jgi:predicted PurR-regulated permease PerM
MSTEDMHAAVIRESPAPTSLWLRRLIISLTLLAWLALFAVLLWGIGQISNAVILLAIAATIATVVHPVSKWLERVLPRPMAIGAIYLVIFAIVGGLFYFLINVIIEQILSLIQYIQSLINAPNNNIQLQPILDMLHRLGISQQQLRSFGQQFIGQLQSFVNNALPFVSNLFTIILNIVLVVLLSIYLLFSGPRMVRWLRQRTPDRIRGNINFLLDTLGRTIGRNFRGVLLLATIISILTGIGLYFIGVPYPLLLSAIAFVLEFVPIIGFYITAITIVLFALTQGWTIALIALAFVLILQAIEGEILSPRIIGGAIGINPILAILAIVAGSQLYGVLGAFFAGPVVGTLQAIVVALWTQWKESHPNQVPKRDEQDQRQSAKEHGGQGKTE